MRRHLELYVVCSSALEVQGPLCLDRDDEPRIFRSDREEALNLQFANKISEPRDDTIRVK